jgi:hypothetical protein
MGKRVTNIAASQIIVRTQLPAEVTVFKAIMRARITAFPKNTLGYDGFTRRKETKVTRWVRDAGHDSEVVSRIGHRFLRNCFLRRPGTNVC